MRDPRLDKLAEVLVSYSTGVRPGQLVAINADPFAGDLIEAIYERVLRAGAHPQVFARIESLDEILLRVGSDAQLDHVSPFDLHRTQAADVYIGLWVERNTRELSAIDPARQARRDAARKPIMKSFMERTSRGELKWVGTLYPTHASAQDAEMSLHAYEDFVFRAGLLHLDDPADAWQRIARRQQAVCDWLAGKSELHFHAPATDTHDGTDLHIDVDPARSVWINCAGTENFPDGEVFTGPQSVDGHVNYTYPAVHHGREVTGIRLAFRDGRVVEASADKNEAFLHEMLDMDAGARTLGEIAIGTNYAIKGFSRNTLFDEKIGGTFHAAVGAGYPESGSRNESGLHWDMVCDLRPGDARPGGTIAADGEVFHRDGRFLNPEWPAPESD